MNTLRNQSWQRRLGVFCLLCASLVQTGARANGQTADKAAEAPAIDPQALAELKKMTSLLDGSQRLLIQSQVTWEAIQDSGMKLQFSADQEIGIGRPNRLYAVTHNDDGTSRKLWYGGGSLTHLDVAANTYAQLKVPETINEMLDHVLDTYDIPAPPMLDFLYGDSETSFLDDVHAAEHVGQSIVGDRPCHHLAFSKENVDYQIWIPIKGKPLPLKYSITWTDDPQLPWFVAHFVKWDVAPTLADSAFTATLPADAAKIEPQKKTVDAD